MVKFVKISPTPTREKYASMTIRAPILHHHMSQLSSVLFFLGHQCKLFLCPFVFQISSKLKTWEWVRQVLIPGLYEDTKDVSFFNTTPYIGDGEAVLVGIPRLRQLRVKRGKENDSLVVI